MGRNLDHQLNTDRFESTDVWPYIQNGHFRSL